MYPVLTLSERAAVSGLPSHQASLLTPLARNLGSSGARVPNELQLKGCDTSGINEAVLDCWHYWSFNWGAALKQKSVESWSRLWGTPVVGNQAASSLRASTRSYPSTLGIRRTGPNSPCDESPRQYDSHPKREYSWSSPMLLSTEAGR